HNVFVERQAPSNMVLPFTEQPKGQGNAFISPLRDVNFGRIYRIVYKDAKPYAPVKLSKDDVPGLVTALKNDNMFWRMTAQRLLVETKDQSVIPALIEIINNPKVDEVGLNSPAVHALWTFKGMGAVNSSNAAVMQTVLKAMSHPAAGVRKTAIEVLPLDGQAAKLILDAGMLKDPNMNVRLKALLALGALPPSVEIGKLIYTASTDPVNAKDEWITKALLAAAITHQDGFMGLYVKDSASTGASQEPGLVQRIASSVSQEIYPLQRRGGSSFPPDVTSKEITVKATISKQDTVQLQGLIMAQGGKDGGYGLYIQNGKLNMVVKQGNKTYKATSTKPLPETFDMVARYTKNGLITLEVDGKQVGKAKAPPLFSSPLSQGLRSGVDLTNENKMGDYEGGFPFTGGLQKGSLELKRISTMKSKTL
ncbi:MAG: hypothetical protein WKF89_14005, partial [Chitinophagaceae bacterium]